MRHWSGSGRPPPAARPAPAPGSHSYKPPPGPASRGASAVGAVGLSALMAAKIAGCDPIVAIDIHDHRLALARELGATHTTNHRTCADVIGEIRKLASGGVRHAVETSAVPA